MVAQREDGVFYHLVPYAGANQIRFNGSQTISKLAIISSLDITSFWSQPSRLPDKNIDCRDGLSIRQGLR